MPEEGPEPHEWVEKAADHHKEEEEEGEIGEEKRRRNMRAALTAAVLAVLAAIGSLLSGHAANDAILVQSEGILYQSQASDQWSYYQAKNIRQNLYEANKDIVSVIASKLPGETADDTEKTNKHFDSLIEKYKGDKEEIKKKAEELEEKANEKRQESDRAFAKHQRYSLGVAAFQVGIVLSSVTIMVVNAWSYPGSVLFGLLGLFYCCWGFFVR
jgi:F0F1-type ATP synthase assembly protein I